MGEVFGSVEEECTTISVSLCVFGMEVSRLKFQKFRVCYNYVIFLLS